MKDGKEFLRQLIISIWQHPGAQLGFLKESPTSGINKLTNTINDICIVHGVIGLRGTRIKSREESCDLVFNLEIKQST